MLIVDGGDRMTEINVVRGERAARGLKQSDMAELMGIPVDYYRRREARRSPWSNSDQAVIVKTFGWTYDEFNAYFYDGKLPFTKDDLPDGG